MGVTSPSTAASGRTVPLLEPLPPLPPLLLAPLLLAPLLLAPLLLAPLLLLPLPPPLLDPLPPLDDPDEPQAEMTTAHASAAMGRREERMQMTSEARSLRLDALHARHLGGSHGSMR